MEPRAASPSSPSAPSSPSSVTSPATATSATSPAGTPALEHLRIGTAPDSWGVWFPDDEHQVPWRRFLDEAAETGYEWIELGPYGYLPTDPERLRTETAARGLGVCAGTVFTALHRGESVWAETWEHVRRIAALAAALGAGHLVSIPAFWRDDRTGELVDERELDAAARRTLAAQTDRLGRALREEFGLRLVVHPHADTHVAGEEDVVRLLEETDPEDVGLCLDTGHFAYCGGDSLDLLRRYGERVDYLHLKQVAPSVLATVTAKDLPFGTAVRRGVMCEPPTGVPDLAPVLREADALGRELFAVVEQDMYPCPPDQPAPIARRTRQLLRFYGA